MERDQHTRLRTRHESVATNLASERTKSKTLNEKLCASEVRANELQKKYDDCKRNYFKIRDERERLKADAEKATEAKVAAEATQPGTESTTAAAPTATEV